MSSKISFSDRLNLIKAAFGIDRTKAINNITQSLQRFIPQYGEPPRNSITNWIKTYNLNPRMNPVHQIASDVAGTKYKIYTKNDKNKLGVPDHSLDLLLNNPCSDISITQYGLFYITQVYLLLPCGEAFWLKERNGVGTPTQLWPVPPNWVMQIPSKTNNYFLIQPMGNIDASPIAVPPEDMIYFKKLNVTNPYLRGMGRVEAIGDEIETDEYMAKFQKKYFHNNAIPAMVGMMPGADEPTIARADEAWKQKYGGYNNSNKMAWLGWDAKLQILKETNKEMDFVESRKYLRDTSNQHFSIPPEIFGILENSNRSTIDAAYYLYTKNVLKKELMFICEALNRQLMIDFDKNHLMEFENVVPDDLEFDLKKSNDGISKGTITVDEWRIANGMEELPDNKGKIIYIPVNLVAVDITKKSIPEEIAASKPAPTEKPIQQQESEKPSLSEAEAFKGGPGSGNFGHVGRPGQVGGSGGGGGRHGGHGGGAHGGGGGGGSSDGSSSDSSGSHGGSGGGGGSSNESNNDSVGSQNSRTRDHIESNVIAGTHGANYTEKTTNFISNDLKVSHEVASGYVEAVRGFTMSDYRTMREASIGKSTDERQKRMAKNFDEFINKSPKYSGEIHRGVSLPKHAIENLKVGSEINMQGMSSWSSDKKIANKFAENSDKNTHPVIFHTKNKSGTSITHLTTLPYQREIVAPSTAKYNVNKIETKGGKTHVYLTEG